MSMAASARGDLRAHQDAANLPVAEVVSRLQEVLGATMVAYLGEARDTRAVTQWATGDRDPSDVATSRLRMAYQAAALLGQRDSADVAQAWLQGMNTQLNDVAPSRVLREQPLEQAGPAVLAAAQAFVAGG